MLDVMIDLETMGNSPDSAIIAIGAVEFDVATREIGNKFYNVVDLESSVALGGKIDPSTVLWWMKQSDEARSAFDRKGEHIAQALLNFTRWMSGCGDVQKIRVWGNGAAFDNVVLASAYRLNVTKQPWEFWNDRCYRTIKAMHPNIKMQRSGTHHNAVDDAESQAHHLIEMLSAGL